MSLAVYSALKTLIMFGLKHGNPEFMKRRGIYIQIKVSSVMLNIYSSLSKCNVTRLDHNG